MSESPTPAVNRRIRRSRDEWEQILSDFRSSNLTQQAFCKQNGISTVSLGKWRKRLQADSPPTGFIPVQLSSDANSPTQSSGGAASVSLRLELGNGVVLHLGIG
jgi:transposase-like protein